jgi:hypothetical protein
MPAKVIGIVFYRRISGRESAAKKARGFLFGESALHFSLREKMVN